MSHPLPNDLDVVTRQALMCLPLDYLRATIATVSAADLTKATKAERVRVFAWLALAESALAIAVQQAAVRAVRTV